MLIKPLNIFGSLLTRELADKLQNFCFVILETAILIAIFHPQITWPGFITFFLFLIAVFLGATLLFFVMLLMGTIGFWSPDTWGIRFLFYMCMDLTAGKFFPIDILPPLFKNILFLTPFPYLSYVQTQIFLGHYSSIEIWRIIAILSVWILASAVFFKYIWNKGMKEYGAVGR